MTNNHYQKNHSSGGASKGFYIALGVCLIAIGVAAWTTYDSVINYATPEEEPSSSQTTAYPANEAVSGVLEVPGSSSPGTTSSTPSAPPSTSPSSQAPQSKAPVSSEEPAVKTTTVPLSFSYPVDGTVVQKFSIDNLIYSKTMKDWRAHAGVDFAAELGTEVKADREKRLPRRPIWECRIYRARRDRRMLLWPGNDGRESRRYGQGRSKNRDGWDNPL